MQRFTRIHAVLLGLMAGILIGLGLLDGCSSPKVVERVRTVRHTDTVTQISYKTVSVPEAYTVVRYRDRDRIVHAQIDSSQGRRDTVLLCENFSAQFSGVDSSNGGSARGWVHSNPIRISELFITCPPDTSTTVRTQDSVTIDRYHHPIVALTAGGFAGIDHEGKPRVGAGVSIGFVIADW